MDDPAWPRPEASNCEAAADAILQIIGGVVRRIEARDARCRLGRSTHDPGGEWWYHIVVIVDDRVHDAFTGPAGLPFDEYKDQFDDHDAIDFGF